MITDRFIEKIVETQNPTCVGLDTAFEYLPEEMREGVTDFRGAANAILTFNRNIIDSVCDIVSFGYADRERLFGNGRNRTLSGRLQQI